MSLRLVLGDQLNMAISSLCDSQPENDTILMCELWDEARYVKHHKKKIAFIFSAMRHFANELRELGYRVHYTYLDDPLNSGSFSGEIERALQRDNYQQVIITEPSEYRVLEEIRAVGDRCNIALNIREDKRFLCTHQEFQQWAHGRKQLRMEFFYREMRKRHHILMDDNQPVGGEWNYDSENRKPPKTGLNIPTQYRSRPDVISCEVMALVDIKFNDHFGDLEPFYFAVTREQALEALTQFIEQRLVHFGDYQDAMVQGEPWMYHSHLSFYINCGLLLPMECIEAVEAAYYKGSAPLNAVEGFIRQILGWREYVRGIYWLNMPDYKQANFLDAKRPLPPLFWGAATRMNCMSQCVQETKANAYAHHIQRLMILGNFALLASLKPDAVNQWYMIVYADAYEWVELPNVTGMILFADGGLLASKPYAASGSYINKMSNYCKHCVYKVSQKNGPDACPFNYLYWDFLIRNQQILASNPRLAMTYKTLQRMSSEKQRMIATDSQQFLQALDNGQEV